MSKADEFNKAFLFGFRAGEMQGLKRAERVAKEMNADYHGFTGTVYRANVEEAIHALNEKLHEPPLYPNLEQPDTRRDASTPHAAAEPERDALQKLSAHEHKQLEFYRNSTAAAEPEKPMTEPMQSYRFALQVIAAGEASDPAKMAREALNAPLYASPSAQPIMNAERYRWLREQMVAENQPKRDQVQFEALYRVLDAADAEVFDGIIDAALKSAGKEST